MHQGYESGQRDLPRDEVAMQLLGKNIFVITMIGAVAFVIACVSVLA
ncbi:MAG: hypothetical protein ABMB14_10940 [Myxococcota bacterium]